MATLHAIQECQDILLPCPEPRAPRCSCLPSQRFPKLHTKAKTPSMHCHTSLCWRVPVTPRGTTDTESLCPPQPGPVGPQRGPGAHHIPPGSAITSPCSGSCVTYASTSVSPPVSLLSWVWVGDPPLVPMAGLRAAPQGTAGLGVGSALIQPRWAPEGDRDTGTGSVKIKPLFHWLDPRL